MGTGLLIYMLAIKDARQRIEANKAICIGKRHTHCPTISLELLGCKGTSISMPFANFHYHRFLVDILAFSTDRKPKTWPYQVFQEPHSKDPGLLRCTNT